MSFEEKMKKLIEDLDWVKRQLELWPGEDCKEMAQIAGRAIDQLSDWPDDVQ